MATVVTEAGFRPDDWNGSVLTYDALTGGEALPEGPVALDLANDRDPSELAPWLERLAMIRVNFPAMTDGRGFSIASRLRAMGYSGRLRAAGPLVADQLTAALGVGFDEIEIPDSMAARQPEEFWSPRPRPSYRSKLLAR